MQAIRLMYVAATNDDVAQLRAITLPDFYVFDVGKKLRTQLTALDAATQPRDLAVIPSWRLIDHRQRQLAANIQIRGHGCGAAGL